MPFEASFSNIMKEESAPVSMKIQVLKQMITFYFFGRQKNVCDEKNTDCMKVWYNFMTALTLATFTGTYAVRGKNPEHIKRHHSEVGLFHHHIPTKKAVNPKKLSDILHEFLNLQNKTIRQETENNEKDVVENYSFTDQKDVDRITAEFEAFHATPAGQHIHQQTLTLTPDEAKSLFEEARDEGDLRYLTAEELSAIQIHLEPAVLHQALTNENGEDQASCCHVM